MRNIIWTSGSIKYAIEEKSGADYNDISHNRCINGGINKTGTNSQVFGNIGYVTENSGTATVANNEWVSHGLATTPTIVTITTRTASYDGVAVIVGWVGQNTTHFQVSAYWTNSTAITDDAINISWHAEV